MKKKSFIYRLAVLVATLMCALGVNAQEAYSCYTSENATLTFYYDNDRSSREGTIYDLNDGAVNPGWVTDFTNANVKQVVFDPSFEAARPTNTARWFYEMRNLESITGLSYLITSEVMRMNEMFSRCYKLTSLDLDGFNTSKVTDISEMFRGCSALQTILVSNGWRLSDMALASSGNMFKDCTSLVGGRGTTYDAAHVDATYAHIDRPGNPGYFTDKEESVPYVVYTAADNTLTFYYDSDRSDHTGVSYDLNTDDNNPAWYTDGTNANVTRVVFDPSFTDAHPTTTYSWFSGMENLQSIEGFENLNTSEVTRMDNMFYSCKALTDLDLTSFNTAKVTSMENMFSICSGLLRIDLTSFNTAKVTNMRFMFGSCKSLRAIFVGPDWSTISINFLYSEHMFYDCKSLIGGLGTTYDVNHTDKAYAHLDGGTSNPGYLTDKNLPVAYVVYTADNGTLTFYYDAKRGYHTGTFYNLNADSNNPAWLIDGTNANVTRVVFDLSFTDARPTTTYSWFSGMQNLQSIEGIEYLNTSEVTRMNYMFYDCKALTSLDLSHFNTSMVTSMRSMFSLCSGLLRIDLTSFNTSNLTRMDNMFNDCSSLIDIYVGPDWSTEGLTDPDDSEKMFSGCESLMGGLGTYYDANHVDAAYAHLDGGTSNPGYFTDKNALVAYVVYTTDDKTLTFYYDNQRSYRTGFFYYLNTEGNNPAWKALVANERIKKVVFDSSFIDVRPTTTESWFSGMAFLETIEGIEYLNTSEVTSMAWMFQECMGLKNIDLSLFNTDKVTRMSGMFHHCQTIKSLDLSTFNTAKVNAMNYMFDMCVNLKTIYVGDGWSTEAVNDSEEMFYGCDKLVGGKSTTYNVGHIEADYAHIDGGAINPGYLSDIAPAPYACYTADNTTLTFYYDNLRSPRQGKNYDLNTENNETGWHSDGTRANVTKVVFDPAFVDARPTTTYGWFSGMTLLRTIEGIENLNTSEVTRMDYMFNDCNELKSLDLSTFNTAKVTSMSSMFSLCVYLESLDLSSFNTANVVAMDNMFHACVSLITIYAGYEWSTAAVTESEKMFNDCIDLVGGMSTSFDRNHMDKEYARIDEGPDTPGYFTMHKDKEAYACYTSENTTLTFYYDYLRETRLGTTYNLNEGDNQPGWIDDENNANVTRVVFKSSFADARPISTYSWFFEMQNLRSIEGLQHLNTSEVTHMGWMFYNCQKLTSLDLSHFNTSNVTSMLFMFSNCSGLTILDLSSFNTSLVTNMEYMFNHCTNLTTIYVGNGWSTDAVTKSEDMFHSCEKLVGDKGTHFDPSMIDKVYAHLDGGPDNYGYFSEKPAFIRGDINSDGKVDISDVVALVNVILSDATFSGKEDVNGDGKVDISDAVALVNIILGQ